MVNYKRKKIILNLIFKFIILNSILLNCFAEYISSKELIENAERYDNKEVILKGEAVGEVMVRGDYSWINVKDDFYAIGIWADKKITKDIKPGNYKRIGDILEIRGIFNKSCNLHGGDIDIHAMEIRILERAKERNIKISIKRIKVLIILTSVLLIEVIFILWKRRLKI